MHICPSWTALTTASVSKEGFLQSSDQNMPCPFGPMSRGPLKGLSQVSPSTAHKGTGVLPPPISSLPWGATSRADGHFGPPHLLYSSLSLSLPRTPTFSLFFPFSSLLPSLSLSPSPCGLRVQLSLSPFLSALIFSTSPRMSSSLLLTRAFQRIATAQTWSG